MMQIVNSMKVTQVAALLFLTMGLRSCEPVPKEYEAFFDLSWDEQKQEASKFPVEKQIEYYLAGRRYVHPPSSTLLYIIADRGRAAIPAILEYMRKASDSEKLDLMEIVRNIHDFHDRLSNDTTTILELSKLIAGMSDPQKRAAAESMLTGIVENSRPRV